jgi:hypothetical protein
LPLLHTRTRQGVLLCQSVEVLSWMSPVM